MQEPQVLGTIKKCNDPFELEVKEDEGVESIRKHVRTGRPLGAEEFVKGLERKLGRVLQK